MHVDFETSTSIARNEGKGEVAKSFQGRYEILAVLIHRWPG